MPIPSELGLTVPLDKGHNRSLFDCGIPALNRYLQQQARQDMRRNVSVCFVIPDERLHVRGFYTLSACAVGIDELPAALASRLPRYDFLPVTLMGRLAVDKPYQQKGLGQFLLLDALRRSLDHAQSIGAMAVVVHAKDAQAEQFYQKFGFSRFRDNPSASDPSNQIAMFMPMQQISSLFPGA